MAAITSVSQTISAAKRPIQADSLEAPDGTKRFTMYNGDVMMDFKPTARKYRYTVTDRVRGTANQPMRGVTSVLGDVVDKPELRTWPLNMSNQCLFGTKYDEVTGEYDHDWQKALIKPGVDYDDETLHEIMLEGSRQWTLRADKGKDVGTLAHDAIEAYLRGTEYVFPSDEDEETVENVKMAKKALETFKKWWNSLEQKKVLEIEMPVYSRNLQYAGTFDLLCEINGKLYILDIKTTNRSKKAPMGIYTEMFLQMGGYSYAVKEERGIKVNDIGVIRVGKDGQLFIATARDVGLDVDACERAFAFAIRVHDWIQKVNPFLSDAHMTSHLTAESKVEDKVASKQ